jgi:NAD(P)-dependent dehydrogenase (short-subunit alcohol dehydrogenase family)
MTTLSGKTALFTGASRGLGRASALKLAQAGAQVRVHFSSGAEEAERVVVEIRKGGGRADSVGVDLAAADGPHKLAKRTRDIIGDRLDILIANAGVSKAATIEDTTVEDFDRLFAVNVRAPFFLVQQLLPILHEGGCIVLLSLLGARAAVGALSLFRDEGRNRHVGEAFRLRARRPRHSRERSRAGRRRDRNVELHQDREWAQLRLGHAGAEAHRSARRHRRRRRLPCVRGGALGHRRHHPCRRRLETLTPAP